MCVLQTVGCLTLDQGLFNRVYGLDFSVEYHFCVLGIIVCFTNSGMCFRIRAGHF